MRYPKNKPWMCTVTCYPNGTNYCHNTQQKLDDESCAKCLEHYGVRKRPITTVRNHDDSLVKEPPPEILHTFTTKSQQLGTRESKGVRTK